LACAGRRLCSSRQPPASEHACKTLNTNCVAGIEANRELLARRVRESTTLVTALNPIIGYGKAAMIAKTANSHRAPIDEVAQALGIQTKEQVDELLVAEKLTQPLRREK
jgi:aspartate ammonia-lyase